MEFFAVGAEYRERCFMAANRVGKIFGAGGYQPPAISPVSTRTGGPAGAF